MNKYIISCDLDNTLLDKKKNISRKTIKYFQKLASNGNYIILNSGRPYQGIIKYNKLLKINHPFIFSDGSGIVYLDDEFEIVNKELFTMDKDAIRKLYSDNLEMFEMINIYEFNDQYFNNKDKVPFWMFHEGESINYHEGDINKILDKDPTNISLNIYKEYNEEFIHYLNNLDDIEYFDWGEYDNIHSYQLFKKGINKASTLKYLAKKLGIEEDNIITFGDGLNDYKLVTFFKEGVAMINSNDKLLKDSKHITIYDYNHDGVRRYLKRFFRNKL